VAVARRAQDRDEAEELAEIEGWYRYELTRPVEIPTYRYEPIRIGPTWQTDTVNGVRYWRLPDRTLGWQMLVWCGRWLQLTRGVPWQFTKEQARFVLWWYELDETGRWAYRDGVMQRLKGWGKDPLGATLCMNEMLGPCRFAEWGRGDEPVGTDNPDAWVQTAAVSLEQTKNTMRLLPGMCTDEAKARFGLQISKETVYALDGTRFMQAVTSSPSTLEGARASFVLMNETHHWDSSNSGHDMADVIERNATKSPGGAARTLRITNAFQTGLDSVAERDREAYDKAAAGLADDIGLFYDSLEAAADAPLTAEHAPEITETIRGDSVWLDVQGIVKSILDIRNPPSRSRRFWYNQVAASEDAWLTAAEWDPCAQINQIVMPDEPIVAFFDGSKSDDATGLVGCRISDGLVFRIGSWTPTQRNPVVDRDDVNAAVVAMFESYRVRAMFADPSDARDDEGERFWEPMIDSWHRTYGSRLDHWSVRSGERTHAIAWDMRSRERQAIFTDAAQRFVTEVRNGSLRHDGSLSLRMHVLNARRRPNEFGITLGKENRSSSKKIDLAVCAVGARMLRRLVENKAPAKKERSGRAW
jgi:hypothetical protein